MYRLMRAEKTWLMQILVMFSFSGINGLYNKGIWLMVTTNKKKDAPPWTCQHVSRHFLQMTSALKRHLLLPASFKHVKCHLFPLLSRPIPPWHFLIFNSSVKLYISPFRKDFPLSTYCQLECIENRCVFFPTTLLHVDNEFLHQNLIDYSLVYFIVNPFICLYKCIYVI